VTGKVTVQFAVTGKVTVQVAVTGNGAGDVLLVQVREAKCGKGQGMLA